MNKQTHSVETMEDPKWYWNSTTKFVWAAVVLIAVIFLWRACHQEPDKTVIKKVGPSVAADSTQVQILEAKLAALTKAFEEKSKESNIILTDSAGQAIQSDLVIVWDSNAYRPQETAHYNNRKLVALLRGSKPK